MPTPGCRAQFCAVHFLKIPACGAALAIVLVVNGCKKNEPAATAAASAETSPGASKTAPVAAAPSKAAPSVPDAVNKVTGRWVRSDGGYVLELRNPDLSGKLEAGYFNPNPIKVSRAIWMQGGSGLQVAVELNDVGYPGATYVLSHDTATDRLVGQYTQPQMQQTFDIEFIRQNAPPLK